MLVLDDARPALEPVRSEFHADAVARGLPLHVTLLIPFVGRDRVDETFSELTKLFREFAPLHFSLAEIREFPGVLWAAPVPDDEIRKLVRAIFLRFPDYPPCDGEFDEVIPHATLAERGGVDALVRARCESLLPIECVVGEVTLLAEREPDHWEEIRRFPLG